MYRRNIFMILVIKVLIAFFALIALGVMFDIILKTLNINTTLFAGLIEVIIFIYLAVKLMLKIHKRLFTLQSLFVIIDYVNKRGVEMIKTYVVNVENKTIKDGMFNKPIKLSNRVNISNSSNIVYIDYRCDEPINEGFIKIETNKNNKLLIYKLPPQRIIMPSIVNPDKDKYIIWTNDCFIAYYNSEWYLSYKNRLLPFFMTNVFWSGCDIVLNDMDFVRICHGRTLNNKSTSLEAIISNFKSYIITILQ